MTALLAIMLGIFAHSNVSNEIPLVAVGFGLRYSPDTPVPVSPDHPLYSRVLIDPIEEMPSSVRLSIARPSSINEGLKLTLEHLHMLAPTSTDAKVLALREQVAGFIAHFAGVPQGYLRVRAKAQFLFRAAATKLHSREPDGEITRKSPSSS
ncbi:hypothetical protein BH11PSE5_BH11PSE5_29680 [soil metagenome]